MDYGKVFDASHAERWLEPAKIQAIAHTANLYSKMKLGPIGPLAIVVTENRQQVRAREYISLSANTERKVALFADRANAELWLAGLHVPTSFTASTEGKPSHP